MYYMRIVIKFPSRRQIGGIKNYLSLSVDNIIEK